MRISKSHSVRAFVFCLLICSAVPGYAAGASPQKADTPEVVVTNPDLVPHDRDASPPQDAPMEQKVEWLIAEVQRLNAVASRATIIITVNLQLAPEIERGNVQIQISGGALEKHGTCKTNRTGQCVFVVDPLAADDRDYRIKIHTPRYQDTEMSFRAATGEILLLPVYVDLTPSEMQRRITPP